ncbi:hypothetical protein DSO57_1036212 [Entomophthora muscae]|uniref:Uncharacterized protein n=1 Tax=Entomophthora muscae TaxID=34485 RepID=A0ACC2TAA6_9FUNG|nr:hypothetical protein DSO57_1036212 [Entomophthora muscae]
MDAHSSGPSSLGLDGILVFSLYQVVLYYIEIGDNSAGSFYEEMLSVQAKWESAAWELQQDGRKRALEA